MVKPYQSYKSVTSVRMNPFGWATEADKNYKSWYHNNFYFRSK
jgi:hypothetical protein